MQEEIGNSKTPPTLFFLRFDQWIVLMGSMIVGFEFYARMPDLSFLGHQIRIYISIAFCLIGPVYCALTSKGAPYAKRKKR